MRLSILIANDNAEKLIENFLLKLKQQTLSPENYEIIISNHGQNETLKALSKCHSELKVKIIKTESNTSYGQAINLAAQHAHGDALLIAHPAFKMLQHDYLEHLLGHAASHPNYGLISTKIINQEHQDISNPLLFEFNHHHGFEHEGSWVNRSILLIRKSVFQQISGFDPDFFMFCDEQDLSLRIKLLDLSLIKLNDLTIEYLFQTQSKEQSYQFYQSWFKAKMLFAYKHFTSHDFLRMLYHLELKSSKKSKIYAILSLTGIEKFRSKKAKWTAIRDSIHKTINESAQWLYFQ